MEYPAAVSDSIRVENLVQFVAVFFTEVKTASGDFRAQPANEASQAEVPSKHILPGYSRIYDMYQQDPKAGVPVHMINLLHFVPETGKQQYHEYLEACAPALGKCSAKVAFHSDIVPQSNNSGQHQCRDLS